MKKDITVEKALWIYLKRKLKVLNDNNKTAKEIYSWITIQKVFGD